MRPNSKQITNLLKNPDPSIVIYLFYGSDRGLTNERIKLILQRLEVDPNDPFSVSYLTGSEVKKNPGRLTDEATSQSLIGGKRVVRLTIGGEDITKALTECLKYNEISTILIEAGELLPRSPVRKFIENNDKTAAIPGYLDNKTGINELIELTLKSHQLTINKTARDYLVNNLGSDRMVTRRELEKLATYMGSEKDITFGDVLSTISDNGAFSMDKVVYPVANGNHLLAEINLQRAFNEGQTPITVIRATIRHFHKLHFALSHIENGYSPQNALKEIKPPILFLFIDEFLGQVNRWSVNKVENALNLLTQAEIDCKTTGMPMNAICGRILLRLSKAVPN